MELATWVFSAEWIVRIAVAVRVIMKRRSVGVSLAWLSVVLLIPFGGAIIYLAIGERRLGSRRESWAARIHEAFEEWIKHLKSPR